MARLRLVLGDKFVNALNVDDVTRNAVGDYYDSEQPKYEVNRLNGEAFVNALKGLSGTAVVAENI